MRPGKKIIAVCGPSGSGKTSLVKELIREYNFFEFSISATTRERREGENDQVDYYFLSINEFEEKVKNNELIEYQEVYQDVYYGTLKSEIDRIWNNNHIPLLDIDVMGAKNLKKIYQDQVMTVFVNPGSYENLKKRLMGRKTENVQSLEKRLSKANFELSQSGHFDRIVMNNTEFEDAYRDFREYVNEFIAG